MKITKIISLVLLIITISLNAFSQDGKIRKANRLYDGFDYSGAADRYDELDLVDAEVIRKEAKSLLNFGNFTASELLFEKLLQNEGSIPEDLYNYSFVLRINEKYKLSDEKLLEYYSKNKSDTRALKIVNNIDYLNEIVSDNKRFKIENLEFNTTAQEFSPFIFNDLLVFTSSRTILGPSYRRYNRNKKPFLNIYSVEIKENGKHSVPVEYVKPINKKFHDGPVCFSDDGTIMAFTRNYYYDKSSDGIRKLKIFFSNLDENGEWGDAYEFPFNNIEYSVGHPYLTNQGNVMYFVSDMPGGKGGTDIYITTKNDSNTWTEPVNLGNNINTEGNEMFPFVTKEENLIFASDGHLGLGGLDLFITDSKMDKVINMGVPLNSNMDDFALVLTNDLQIGYFSSNRKDGKGDDDIYEVKVIDFYNFNQVISGICVDSKGELLPNSKVVLYNQNDGTEVSIITGDDASFSFTVEGDKQFKIVGTKEDYFDDDTTLISNPEIENTYVELVLEKDPGFSLYGLITDSKTSEPVEGVNITLKNNGTGESEINKSSNAGDFLRILEDSKLNDQIDYTFTLEKEGYFSKVVDYKILLIRPGQYNIHETLDLTMDIEVEDLTELVKINPIYFDLDKYKIRPDAALELDKIVDVMNKYPNMVVELGSHTDCRAPASYNRTLSDNRAKASAEYIKEKIVNPERITGKGYGESQLINKCECEGSRVIPCTEDEHQENRRTEFKVISTGNDRVRVIE